MRDRDRDSQSELDLSNPDKPHVIPCHANNYTATLAWIREHNGHVEQIKVGPGNGDYELRVGW